MISLKSNNKGVTIIELMVAIAMAGFVSISLIAITLYLFGGVIRNQIAAEMATDSHFSLRAIVEDLRLSDGISPSANLTDDNAPSGGWVTSSDNGTLIVERPATTIDNDIIYNDSTGDPYLNEFVYHLVDDELRKRHIGNDAATGNETDTTCPPENPESGCSSDNVYTDYVTDFSFTFYDSNNNEVSPSLAEFIEVSLTMERKIFGKTVSQTNSITVKPRN